MNIPDQALIDRERVRRGGLREFVKRAWHIVEPGKFVDNWHIGVLCEHLEACQRREIRKLVINIPPGCMKSLTVSVFYPAWCWTLEPTERFLFVSYAADVAERDALRMRNIIGSDWFRERWGLKLQGTKKIKYFENSERGFRMSAQMGGQVTGKHAHQTWVDDPIKPEDTLGGADQTRVMLKKSVDFWRGTLYNRQAEPERHVHGLMMQRLHDADLAGVLLEDRQYTHLMLPMRYEPKRKCVTPLGVADPRTEDGELLWKARFPEKATKDLEDQLAHHAHAQMQQDPVPSTGGIFQGEWLLYWHTEPSKVPGTLPLPDLRRSYLGQSWDMAFKGKQDSDRVAGGAFALYQAKNYLIDATIGRMGYSDSKDAVKRLSQRYPRFVRKLVEDKANGTAIVDDLQHDFFGFELVEPEGGKEARAWACQPIVKSGGLVLPHPSMPGYEWVHDVVKELTRFPKAPNDDAVDMITQWLNYVKMHAPKWVQAMSQVIAKEQAASAPPAPAPATVAPPAAPVDVAGLRARLGLVS